MKMCQHREFIHPVLYVVPTSEVSIFLAKCVNTHSILLAGDGTSGGQLASTAAAVLRAPLPWQQRLAAVHVASAIATRVRSELHKQPQEEGPVAGSGGYQNDKLKGAARQWAVQLAEGVVVLLADVSVQQVCGVGNGGRGNAYGVGVAGLVVWVYMWVY
jgi:hypothetical protein